MRYREWQPGEESRAYVSRYWTLDDDAPSPDAVQRIVPDGRPELIVNLGDPFEQLWGDRWQRQPKAFLAGQISQPMLVRPAGGMRILGVRFHAWGVARLSGIPMDELAGGVWPVEDALPTLAGLDDLSRIDREIRRLGRTRAADRAVESAAAKIVTGGGQIRVDELAAEAGLSARQLDRRFLDRVGLHPKMFCRIQRFQKVFEGIADPLARWADVAVDCGYYDQAHLIRDFRDFAGEAPSILLRETSDLARHFLAAKMSDSSKTYGARSV